MVFVKVPEMNNWGLIDPDTPKAMYTKTSLEDGSKLQLVFSDEFNKEGRTFWPGDDPFWEAHDMHYWVRFIYVAINHRTFSH